MIAVFRTKIFWLWFLIVGAVTGAFFAWELGLLPNVPVLPRPPATTTELWFSGLLGLLLALNAGLLAWQNKYGSCPLGTRKATGLAGALGAFTLICPVCLLIPITVFGVGVSLAIFSPYLPLLRVIALILLSVSTWMLWPRGTGK